jgi:hypothetical protein
MAEHGSRIEGGCLGLLTKKKKKEPYRKEETDKKNKSRTRYAAGLLEKEFQKNLNQTYMYTFFF